MTDFYLQKYMEKTLSYNAPMTIAVGGKPIVSRIKVLMNLSKAVRNSVGLDDTKPSLKKRLQTFLMILLSMRNSQDTFLRPTKITATYLKNRLAMLNQIGAYVATSSH